MNFPSTTSVTSLLASAAGHWPCGGPGLKASPESGLAPAPANRSVAPGEEREPKTNATFGQTSETSSELADLPLFSGSRSQALPLSERLGGALARRLARFGSMEFEATWSQRATPLGLRYWAHIPSARRTGGKGCIGWPTASARDWKDTPGMSETGVNPDGSVRSRLDMLPRVAALAAWPTPDSMQGAGGAQDAEKRKEGGHHIRLQDAVTLAGWPTPTVSMATEQDMSQAMTAGYGKGRKAYADSGILATSCPAATARPAGYRLNPRFSLWLMGYPDAWASCGERAMQSFRSARRSS